MFLLGGFKLLEAFQMHCLRLNYYNRSSIENDATGSEAFQGLVSESEKLEVVFICKASKICFREKLEVKGAVASITSSW